MKRNVEFGETGDSDDENDSSNRSPEYNQDFETEQLSRITKMAGLSTNMQIYTKNGSPLLFKSDIGNIGKIAIYIKSKDLIEKENNTHESEEENDESEGEI